jgi:putative transcriptional regulator
VPRIKTVRRALGLTQRTLRDWEQGRKEPDQPARAYLRAIAGNPEAVAEALRSGPSG